MSFKTRYSPCISAKNLTLTDLKAFILRTRRTLTCISKIQKNAKIASNSSFKTSYTAFYPVAQNNGTCF
jgi:hypothetical protein